MWLKPSKDNPSRIIETENTGADPIEVYSDRYSKELPDLSLEESVKRVWDEIFSNFGSDSSVLMFGSGHSFWANNFGSFPNIKKISALDYVREAGLGLKPEIEFFCENILVDGIKGEYDYIYSAHTVEHFTRSQVLDYILPTCLNAAKKAVVFVVPYGTNWSEEPSHKCLFYETDELTAKASKYKIIRNGQELVLWFDKE